MPIKEEQALFFPESIQIQPGQELFVTGEKLKELTNIGIPAA